MRTRKKVTFILTELAIEHARELARSANHSNPILQWRDDRTMRWQLNYLPSLLLQPKTSVWPNHSPPPPSY